MAQTRFRNLVAVASMFLAFLDAGAAFAMPVAPMADSGYLSPTLVRGARGGGRGFHGGGVHGARGFHGGVGHAGVARGGAVYRGGAVRGGAVYRGGAVHRGAVAWRRPYRWPAGGAIAAGAAIGFVTAGAAAAYVATRPPTAGLCWYYTDASRTQGFWDNCP